MPDLQVVHLVWAPLGTRPLELFLASYRSQPAGAPHRLAVIFKGFGTPEAAVEHQRLLAGIEHDALFYDQPTLDLPAYAHAARTLDAEHLCFLNSESVLLAPGWLGALREALAPTGVGIVSATASYERTHSLIPTRRRRWPRFPNPHLRTNAFMLARRLMLSADWPPVETKARAWELESGYRSLTRHAWSQGLEALVAGRGGTTFRPHEWAASATFRGGRQENLLVADNRTREWDEAGAAERAELSRRAWGEDPAAAASEVERTILPMAAGRTLDPAPRTRNA
jgi:hypothetical protein